MISNLHRLLVELEALPVKFQRCVLDASSNWNELVMRAIIADKLGIPDDDGTLASPNAKAIDFTIGGRRVSCKRVGNRGSIAQINAKHEGLIDALAIIYQGDGAPRYFLVPWADYSAAATRYGPYPGGRMTMEVRGGRIPIAFATHEILVAESVPFNPERRINDD
jgi:hypothetical protein